MHFASTISLAGLLLGPAVVLSQAPSTPDSTCLHFAAVTTLRGRLQRLTFPGPPNYKSVAEGDRAETGYYLRLKPPICVRPDSRDSASADPSVEPKDSVSLVQLLLTSRATSALDSSVGTWIAVQGKLSSAHTGHHHAPILMIDAEPFLELQPGVRIPYRR